MNEEERNELRRMIEDEQEDARLRDKVREIEKANLESAMHLRGMYNSYIRVGFSEMQAFSICMNYQMFVLQQALNKPIDPGNRKIF